jgi:hypothetical protein
VTNTFLTLLTLFALFALLLSSSFFSCFTLSLTNTRARLAGTSGSFRMKFRGQTTGDISFGAHVVTSSESGTSIGTGTGESLESKLEALSTIEDVTVSVTGSSTGKICDNDSAKFKITFTHEHGDLVRWRKKTTLFFTNVCCFCFSRVM